jgi:hypothetical protein
LAELIALRLKGFYLSYAGTAFYVEFAKISQYRGRVHAPGAQLLFDERKVLPHKTQIQHK